MNERIASRWVTDGLIEDCGEDYVREHFIEDIRYTWGAASEVIEVAWEPDMMYGGVVFRCRFRPENPQPASADHSGPRLA